VRREGGERRAVPAGDGEGERGLGGRGRRVQRQGEQRQEQPAAVAGRVAQRPGLVHGEPDRGVHRVRAPDLRDLGGLQQPGRVGGERQQAPAAAGVAVEGEVPVADLLGGDRARGGQQRPGDGGDVPVGGVHGDPMATGRAARGSLSPLRSTTPG
jgi:hypothetical protein